MVGLVIVSHSARLAEGVAELVRGLGGPEVPVAAAGGLDAPGAPLGTDAARVKGAIEEVYSDDGVLVLMDLGSALLSAELAVELLPEGRRGRVLLCEAALVEGAVAAAVQSRLGAPLERAAEEALAALLAKRTGFAGAPPPPAAPPGLSPGPTEELRLVVKNRHGLHARPAARLVRVASRFPEAELLVTNLTSRRGPASARSLNALMTLGVRGGQEIAVLAGGPSAHEALLAVRALSEAEFGERGSEVVAGPGTEVERPAEAAKGQVGSTLRGVPVSAGIAVGNARPLLRPPLPVKGGPPPGAPAEELGTLARALESARREIAASRDAVALRAGPAAAAILEAHLCFLEDEALLAPVREAIARGTSGAAEAFSQSIERALAAYRDLEDEYQRARAQDLEEVGRKVLFHLAGGERGDPKLPAEPGVLLAEDLTAAEVARLDPGRVLGVAAAGGGPTSHGAILARALSIPAVAGLGPAILLVAEGTPIVLDGSTGEVSIGASPERLAEARSQLAALERSRAAARAAGAGPARTRDGRRVFVMANVGSAAEARAAVFSGAEGVGLLRTEFLFQGRRAAPDEEEQVAAYRAVAEALSGRPLVVRTLDAGGDKPLPYLDTGNEANPYLGFRAIRACLAEPAFFKVQLRAILRTAREFPVEILFPMIATLKEWRAARALLEEAKGELQAAGRSAPSHVPAGVMVEVPSAALQAAALAREVDFFSLGTNDLVQYTMAAERGHPRLAALSDPLEPAVLELLRRAADAAQAAGKKVAVCGEAAADPVAVPLLVGLGVSELSVSAPAIPAVKEAVRALHSAEARSLALGALALEDALAVRAFVAGRVASGGI